MTLIMAICRRLAKQIIDGFVDLLSESKSSSFRSTSGGKKRRTSSSSSKRLSTNRSTGGNSTNETSGDVGRCCVGDASRLRDVKPDSRYVDSVLKAYTSAKAGCSSSTDVSSPLGKEPARQAPSPQDARDIVSLKLELYERASHVIAEHGRRYLKRKNLSDERRKLVLKRSTKEYFQSIRRDLSTAAEKCLRFPDYHQYFTVDDLIKVEAIHRVIKRHIISDGG